MVDSLSFNSRNLLLSKTKRKNNDSVTASNDSSGGGVVSVSSSDNTTSDATEPFTIVMNGWAKSGKRCILESLLRSTTSPSSAYFSISQSQQSHHQSQSSSSIVSSSKKINNFLLSTTRRKKHKVKKIIHEPFVYVNQIRTLTKISKSTNTLTSKASASASAANTTKNAATTAPSTPRQRLLRSLSSVSSSSFLSTSTTDSSIVSLSATSNKTKTDENTKSNQRRKLRHLRKQHQQNHRKVDIFSFLHTPKFDILCDDIYYPRANAFIFVIDSTTFSYYSHCHELNQLIGRIVAFQYKTERPILILANKQDSSKAIPLHKLEKMLGLHHIVKHQLKMKQKRCRLQGISAIANLRTGGAGAGAGGGTAVPTNSQLGSADHLRDALEWLTDDVSTNTIKYEILRNKYLYENKRAFFSDSPSYTSDGQFHTNDTNSNANASTQKVLENTFNILPEELIGQVLSYMDNNILVSGLGA